MSTFANGRAQRRARIRRIIHEQSRHLGCRCRPTLRIDKLHGLDHADVAHDIGCPAGGTGRTIALVPKSHGWCGR